MKVPFGIAPVIVLSGLLDVERPCPLASYFEKIEGENAPPPAYFKLPQICKDL
jgi:hypothetical protein